MGFYHFFPDFLKLFQKLNKAEENIKNQLGLKKIF